MLRFRTPVVVESGAQTVTREEYPVGTSWNIFSEQAGPCSQDRVREIEHNVGRQLPGDYRAMIMGTGGGVPRNDKCFLHGSHTGAAEDKGVELRRILGDGSINSKNDNCLDITGMHLSKEWDIPHEILLIAYSENGLHEYFALNYELTKFPFNSVLYIDQDREIIVQIADSFSSLVSGLTSNPHDIERPDTSEEDVLPSHDGSFPPLLRSAVSRSSIDNIEDIVRSAGKGIGSGKNMIVNKKSHSLLFLDILFALATNVTDIIGGYPDSSDDSGQTSNGLTFLEVFPSMASEAGSTFSAIWSEPPIRYWWKTRMNEGAIIEENGKFRLSDDYLLTVLSEATS